MSFRLAGLWAPGIPLSLLCFTQWAHQYYRVMLFTVGTPALQTQATHSGHTIIIDPRYSQWAHQHYRPTLFIVGTPALQSHAIYSAHTSITDPCYSQWAHQHYRATLFTVGTPEFQIHTIHSGHTSITDPCYYIWLFMGSGDSNSGPFVYIASALSTDPSSNSLPKFSALVLSINIFFLNWLFRSSESKF